MNKTAYLVAFFDTSSGRPNYTGSGIYSAQAKHLTNAIGPSSFACDVVDASGKNYDEAKKNLLAYLRGHGKPAFGWALQGLET